LGGSGGQIQIWTENKEIFNELPSNSTAIEARGGNGAMTNGFGGSGGAIVWHGVTNSGSNSTVGSEVAVVSGGLRSNRVTDENGCGNGAAGVTYYSETDEIIVANKGVKTISNTYL
jgi:hypothetical protein